MSFARQLSICRGGDDVAIAATELEWRLARLQRPGMFGGQQIRQILPPGKYRFDPLNEPNWRPTDWQALDASERRKGHIRPPRRMHLNNVSWQRSDELDWTLHLPTGEDVVTVPVDETDDAGLGYYNCRLIGKDDVISLHHRSIIVNFHYKDEYLRHYVLEIGGGCSIEQHEFAHVNMPLDMRSGHLVLGKMDPVDHSLELTAFIVRPMQRVYIPAQTIHTNDFLLGRWESLLSSACEFPSAQIKPSADAGLDRAHEHALPPVAFCE